jgi:TonB-linked SusC/RagA family outer membrane protein
MEEETGFQRNWNPVKSGLSKQLTSLGRSIIVSPKQSKSMQLFISRGRIFTLSLSERPIEGRFLTKIQRVMKLAAILMLITCLRVSADSYAQTVTWAGKEAPIETVFSIIKKQTGYVFFYNYHLIQEAHPITLDVKNIPVEKMLTLIFKNQPFYYSIVGKTIVITKKPSSGTFVTTSYADIGLSAPEDTEISGSVTNENGEPLIGVSVSLKGSSTGSITGASGIYSLSVPDANQGVLVFSYIGYTNLEVPISGRTHINAVMKASVSSLDQLVVVGYGTARKSDLVGSVASVPTEDMKNQPSSRIDETLQGRSPGLVIQNNSASPDGSISIRIRGNNSINGSNDPLVVVDGFLGGDLSSINPNDIASVEVLKDASATAIYGSRGSNGVILITTKKGAPGKIKVQYNSYFSFQSVRKKMDLLNAAQYAEAVDSNRSALNLPLPFSQEQIDQFKANGGTDWQDVIFRNALQQAHQVNISGGGDKVSYYLSGNLVDNMGVIRGSSFKRYSLRSNITSNVSDHFDVGLNLFLSKSENHPIISGGSQDNAPTHAAEVYAPTLPVYNPDGSYTLPSSSYGPPAVYNPLALAVEPINDNLGMRTVVNTFVNYHILKGLTAKVLFGMSLLDQQNSYYLNTKPMDGLGVAEAGITNSRDMVLQNTNQINYQTTIGDAHHLDVTAVYEQQSETYNTNFAGSNGFSSDGVTYNNLSLGSAPQIPTSSKTKKVIQSFVGRVNYSYREKYLLSLTGRYDGASVFGENHKWGFFPSAAIAWRVDKESFMRDVRQIDNLKIRTSYGVTGSQAVAPYNSLDQLNSNLPYVINGQNPSTGVGLGSIGNPDLRWEKTAQFDVGVDLGLFDSRIQFTADYYYKKTSDLLLNVPLPLTSGYRSVLRNLGEVENKGVELNLGGNPFVGKFKWNTNVNFALNRNKVLALGGQDEITLGSTGFPNFGNTIFLVVGEPIGVLKGYIQDGIWGTHDAAEAESYGTIPGAPRYVDINNDGHITSADVAIMGTTLPKFTYGWSNNFSYSNFDLSVLMQGAYGNKVYNLSRVRTERSSSDADATDVRILKRWSPENQNTNVPSFLGSNQYEQIQSSRWLENGSYLRIKTITLAYNIPQALLEKIKIDMARIYVSGVNLFTFTKYTGYDPEESTNVDTRGGIDFAAYPSQKSYTVGINLTF